MIQLAGHLRVVSRVRIRRRHVSYERTGNGILRDMRDGGVSGAERVEDDVWRVVVDVIDDHVDCDVNGVCFRRARGRVGRGHYHLVLGCGFTVEWRCDRHVACLVVDGEHVTELMMSRDRGDDVTGLRGRR